MAIVREVLTVRFIPFTPPPLSFYNTFNITKATLANKFDSSLNRGQDNKFQIPPLTCEGGAGGRGLRLSADGWR